MRAPCRAGWVGPRSVTGHCTGGKPLSFVARPWYDVPAVASTLRSGLSRDTRTCATALAIAREEAQHASFPRVRTVPGGLWSVNALWKDTAPAESLSPCQLRSPLCAAGFRVPLRNHCARSLSRGGAARELAERARRARQVVVDQRPMEGHCTRSEPLSFCARPWCDVPAFAWQACARNRAGCLSGRRSVRCTEGLGYGRIEAFPEVIALRSLNLST